MNYIDNRVSVKQTIKMLAKNGITVNENEANIIWIKRNIWGL